MTIGELEREAGIAQDIESRRAFWLRFRNLDARAVLEAGTAELKRMIAERRFAEVARAHGIEVDEYVALRDFADRHGRLWKSKLRAEWEIGRASPVLQEIKNTRGNVWLRGFHFRPLDNEGTENGRA